MFKRLIFIPTVAMVLTACDPLALDGYGATAEKTSIETAMEFLREYMFDEREDGRQITTINNRRVFCAYDEECQFRANFTMIVDGFADTSIRGQKHELVLVKYEGQPWKIVSHELSWACRRGGYDGFRQVICP